MIRLPNAAPPALVHQSRADYVEETRLYELITPLFGGSATPGVTDGKIPIRGAEIRGHLRFWWRATRGASPVGTADPLADMRERECALWGTVASSGASTQSKVDVRVEIVSAGTLINWDDGSLSAVKYALFPLESAVPTGQLRTGVKFRLALTYPANKVDEVHAALWAWETFGGIGARTRRGCGALKCISINDESGPLVSTWEELEKTITKELKTLVRAGQWHPGVPHLDEYVIFKFVKTRFTTPLDAWGALISRLRAYRQQRQSKTFGRSMWPEPDAIRRRASNRYPDKQFRKVRDSLTTIDKFPRGQFGLPIVFHFAKEYDDDSDLDATLQGAAEGFHRWASPLILRPIAVQHGAAAMAAILRGSVPHEDGVELYANESIYWRNEEVRQVQLGTAFNGKELDTDINPVQYFVNDYLNK